MTAQNPGSATQPTAPQQPVPPARPQTRQPARSGRRVLQVRKVHPWSVLKLSLVFYFAFLLVVMLGLIAFWAVLVRMGVIDTVLGLAAEVGLPFEIDGGALASGVFLVGLLNVVLWSGINVFAALLYNLVADLLGGLKLTLTDDR
ncbi:hypothetical protein ER308_10780 [Egibacter rhizosphaerae]|uniref:DUF3566 domain-containing protein n=1 Tax=Egibacter rhizosphaerae TaxID=1670831 RepID=A0A411YFF6_9ACTN|nr:DUF3566 domain-containing protein [Egibacter rhizosphaerae]QBI19994.1 hypothetical protein ER308_10780 [Egibacter rhizosphaerae]